MKSDSKESGWIKWTIETDQGPQRVLATHDAENVAAVKCVGAIFSVSLFIGS